MKKIIVMAFVSVIMTACGGSGGGSKSSSSAPPPSSSSSVSSSTLSSSLSSEYSESSVSSSSAISSFSSSSISSSSVDAVKIVYDDALNDAFGHFSRYETNDRGDLQDLTQAQGDYLVTWTEEDEGDNRVITVDYSGKADSAGQFEITGDIDLSDYSTGRLEFDIRVNSQGSSVNAPPALFVQFECSVWPCSSHRQSIVLGDYDIWETVVIQAKDLEDTGLDFSQLVKSFVIRPDDNNGVTLSFSLDNIRWVKGDENPETLSPLFVEHFSTRISADKWTASLPANDMEFYKFVEYGLNVLVNNNAVAINSLLIRRTFDDAPISVVSKSVSGYLRGIDSYSNNAKVVVSLKDSAGLTTVSESIELFTPRIGQFVRFNLDIDNDMTADTGFDADDVKEIVFEVIFRSDHPQYTSVVTIDEIRIE